MSNLSQGLLDSCDPGKEIRKENADRSCLSTRNFKPILRPAVLLESFILSN